MEPTDVNLSLKDQLEIIRVKKEELEKREAEIYQASLDAPENEKVCEDFVARYLSTPLKEEQVRERVVRTFRWRGDASDAFLQKREVQLVVVRLVDDRKTYLGIYLGDLALGAMTSFHEPSGVMTLGLGFHNPAILVPALKRIVFGCESWWGPITSEDDFKHITDETINNVWYVKLLREKLGREKLEKPNGPE